MIAGPGTFRDALLAARGAQAALPDASAGPLCVYPRRSQGRFEEQREGAEHTESRPRPPSTALSAPRLLAAVRPSTLWS